MPEIISFINMKGGVGKTTLTVNIGYALAYIHKKNVLLIDCDPQFNASTYLMKETEYIEYSKDRNKRTILDIFVPDRIGSISTVQGKTKAAKKGTLKLSSCIFNIYKKAGNFDLIPSSLEFMQLETSQRGTENRLHNFIKEKCGAYDYILIDCPPTISIFTQAGIIASEKYLVPLKPDPLSTMGLPLLERWLEVFTESLGTELEPLGMVFCNVRSPQPRNMKDVMNDLRSKRSGEIFNDHLTQSTKIAESVEAHKPIFLYDKNSKWANELLSITEEFLKRTEE